MGPARSGWTFQGDAAVFGSKGTAAQEPLVLKLVNLFESLIREPKGSKGSRCWSAGSNQKPASALPRLASGSVDYGAGELVGGHEPRETLVKCSQEIGSATQVSDDGFELLLAGAVSGPA